MEGLLERLAKLSLKKAGALSKTAGKYGGAALGGPAGAIAGEAIGGGVKGLLDTLAEDKRNPHSAYQVNNLHSFQQSPSFGQRLGGNVGGELIDQAGQMGEDALAQFAPGSEGMGSEKSIAEQIQELLDSMSPEERASILERYAGGQ